MREQQAAAAHRHDFRDAHQSLLATRLRTRRHARDRAALCAPAAADCSRSKCGAGRPSTWPCASSRSAPGSAWPPCARAMPNICFQMLLRASNAVGYTNYPDNVVRDFVRRRPRTAWTCSASSTRSIGCENMRVAMDAVLETGRLCEAAICYTGDLFDPRATSTTWRTTSDGEGARARGRARPRHQGHGRALPAARGARSWSRRSGKRSGCRCTSTPTTPAASRRPRVLAAVEAGVDAVDGAIDSMSGTDLAAEPGLDRRGAARGPRDTGLDPERLRQLSNYWEQVRARLRALRERHARRHRPRSTCTRCPAASTPTCASRRARSASSTRWPEVARAYAEVNRMFGDIVKVTPTSKVVGDMALMMVDQRPRRRAGARPGASRSLSQIGRGVLPRRPGPAVRRLPGGVAAQGAEGRRAPPVRPGGCCQPVDLERARQELQARGARPRCRRELASYLMYPKVYIDYVADQRSARRRERAADADVLLRARPGEEMTVDIERGKTLIIRLVTVSDVTTTARAACSSS